MVTFETKVWENDWEYILTERYLKEIIKRCAYPFAKKVIMINNVKDVQKVSMQAQRMVKKGIINEYFVVEEHADKALAFFELNKSTFENGYVYSISELVSVYLCDTSYLLHFAGDSYMSRNPSTWVAEALNEFPSNNRMLVANAAWDRHHRGAKEEAIKETEHFYIGSGFSDQCFLIRVVDFKEKIYNHKNELSERYPKYGGELFEKRIDAYMKNNDLERYTSKKDFYIHENWPKNNFKGFLRYIFRFWIISSRLKSNNVRLNHKL